MFWRATQNCGSLFLLSQVLQTVAYISCNDMSSNNAWCRALAILLRLVITSRSSSVKDQQKVMGYKETVVETRSENDTCVTGNIMWMLKVGRAEQLMFTLKHFKFANIHGRPPNGSLGLFTNNCGKLGSSLIYYSVFSIKLVFLQTGFKTENQLLSVQPLIKYDYD